MIITISVGGGRGRERNEPTLAGCLCQYNAEHPNDPLPFEQFPVI